MADLQVSIVLALAPRSAFDVLVGELDGRAAGFEEVRVIRRDLEPFARAAGVPGYALALFSWKDGGARFLIARRREGAAGRA